MEAREPHRQRLPEPVTACASVGVDDDDHGRIALDEQIDDRQQLVGQRGLAQVSRDEDPLRPYFTKRIFQRRARECNSRSERLWIVVAKMAQRTLRIADVDEIDLQLLDECVVLHHRAFSRIQRWHSCEDREPAFPHAIRVQKGPVSIRLGGTWGCRVAHP